MADTGRSARQRITREEVLDLARVRAEPAVSVLLPVPQPVTAHPEIGLQLRALTSRAVETVRAWWGSGKEAWTMTDVEPRRESETPRPRVGVPPTWLRLAGIADNGTAVSLFTWLGPAVGILLVIFAVGLRHVLASTDVDRAADGLWSRLSWTGVVVQFAASLVGLGIRGVLAQESVIDEISDGTLLAFSAFDSIVFFVCMAWASTLFLGAAAVVILRSTALPTWTGIVAAVAALATPVGGLWILTDGDPAGPVAGVSFIGGLGKTVFVLATSVIMLRQRATRECRTTMHDRLSGLWRYRKAGPNRKVRDVNVG